MEVRVGCPLITWKTIPHPAPEREEVALRESVQGRYESVIEVGHQNGLTLRVFDLVDALTKGRNPELSGHRALRATELSFTTYESSRRRGRIDLPFGIDDSPLIALLAAAKETDA